MAEPVYREAVSDPLALNPRQQGADRSLPTYGVRNPMQTAGNAATKQGMQTLGIIDGLQAALGRVVEANTQEALVEGELMYMQGATEEAVAATGNKYTKQGYQALGAVDQAAKWYSEEMQFLEQSGMQMDPDEYRKTLMERRKTALDNLPKDPAVRRAYAAAFKDFGPRLMSEQVIKHNEYNTVQAVSSFSEALLSGAGVNEDASFDAGDGFRVSQAQVSDPVEYDEVDRDVAIRTMLGEAAGEGPQGMAAVAHVLINRTKDRRYGGRVKDVALADKQFSAWNSGEGGNSLVNLSPDSAAYKKAAHIFDTVAQGFHVDPTGGATHYYSPKGMKGGKEPDWWGEEVARAGGAVKVGNHVFAGKAVRSGKGILEFAHADQTGIQPEFQTILEDVADEFGGRLKITSGHRSKDHPVEAAKASGGGEHTHGTAVDIDMSGMNEEQRRNLVMSLRQKGVLRFGTYDNHPNMLHVDMKDQKGDGSTWAMHNKSNRNMAGAPKWFQEAMTEGVEVASTNTYATGRSSRIQNFIRNSPLRPHHKATAVADAMRRALDSGDDTLFNDAGGISLLHGLGAKPSEIDEVLKAKERFDAEKDKQFDVTYEKGRAEILARVQSGDFATLEDALDAVEQFHNEFGGSHSEAKSLARTVASDWAKAGEDAVVPLELRNLGASLYEKLQTGVINEEQAGQEIIDFGKENGIKASVVNNFVASMYSAAQNKRDKDRTAAKTELEKQQKEKDVIAQVDNALAKGYGLKGLGGRVRIPDDNVPSGKREVSGEEYGIWKLKKSVQEQYMADVSSGRLTPEAAGPMMNKDVYEQLAKQGVADTEFGRQLGAAVAGDFIKDGAPTENALQAMDFYMQMRDNPSVGTQYMATMLDEDARTFFETAANLYDGRLSLEDAMTKAHAVLNDPLDPPKKIEKSAAFYAQVGDGVERVVKSLADEGGFLTALMGETTYRKADVESAILNDTRAKSYIASKAETYHLINPREPIKVSIKKAADDLANNSILIGDQLVIGNKDKGQRLDQRMGLDALGKDAPQKALTAALQNYGPQWWGKLWEDQTSRGVFVGKGEAITGADGRKTSIPPYRVTYQPEQGIIEVELYKDKSRTETIGEPLILDVKAEIGDPYRAQAKIGEGNTMLDLWRGFKESAVDIMQYEPAEQPGAAVGRMLNQQ